MQKQLTTYLAAVDLRTDVDRNVLSASERRLMENNIPLIRIDCDWFFSGILDICFCEHGHNEQSMARTMADPE